MNRPWTRRTGLLAVSVLSVVLFTAGCSSNDKAAETTTTTADTTTTGPSTTQKLSGELTVMSPGPLKALLESAKTAFETDHPDVTITFNLGHVPTLLTQIESGVPGDLLLTPDAGTMGQAADKGLLDGDPKVLARSPMALVVPAGNPGGIKGIDALGAGDKRVAVCAVELPCGKLAQQLAKKNSLSLNADTLEPGGSPGIVTKASTGEIDVGLVFATDIKAGGDKVEAILIPKDQNVSSEVSAAVLKETANQSLARTFLEFLMSPDGQNLATSAGFEKP